MVDSVNSNPSVKLNGTNIQLNKENVKATVLEENKTPLFMKKYDANDDGVISKSEAMAMLNDLNKVSKDGTLSSRELENKSKIGAKGDFEKLKNLYEVAKQMTLSSVGEGPANAKGKTKTTTVGDITTTVTENDDGTITKKVVDNKTKMTTVSSFDADGNLVKQQAKDKDGNTKVTTNQYDKEGKMVSSSSVNRNSKGQVTSNAKTTYRYDEYGNRIGYETNSNIEGKKTTTKVNIENNADGKPVKTTSETTNAKGQVLSTRTESIEYDSNGVRTCVNTTQDDKENNKTVETSTQYQKDGKTLAASNSTVKDNKAGTTTTSKFTYNENGKLKTSHNITVDKNNVLIKDLTTTNEYAKDGKTIKKSETSGKNSDGDYSEVINFDDKGKMSSIDKSYFRRGAKFEDHYEGPNLENRKGYIPSRQIEYEEDGKTVKQVTDNQFDKDGVLIGETIKDKDGNIISTHDFSKVDGNFDTSYQKGRGDCYLLAGLNSLRSSEEGKEILKQTITEGIDPKTHEKTYTVNFPGAKEARQKLLDAGVPEDQITIQDSYTYTESQVHEKAKEAGIKYSAGDKDVLLLEVAYEQYRTDAKDDIADLRKANPNIKSEQAKEMLHVGGLNARDKKDNLRTGQGADAVFLLTGKDSIDIDTSNNTKGNDMPICSIDSNLNMTLSGEGKPLSPEKDKQMEDMFNAIEQDCKDGKLDNYAINVGFFVSSQTVNGEVVKGGGHAFSITRVEGDKVYLTNPWDPTKEIVMTRDEVKQAMTRTSITPLTEEGEAETSGIRTSQKPSDNNPINQNNNGGSTQNITETPQAGNGYRVPKGKGYKTMIKEALIAQGIEPTPENIQKASAQFKEMNKGAVKIYNGMNAKYRGNEYLIANDVVKIPKFEI